MKSVRNIVRPFSRTELDEWFNTALGVGHRKSPSKAIYRKVYQMEFWLEVKLTKPVRRAVFWPLTNFLSGLLKEEFYGEDS